jgi:hypothetical protein
MATGSHTRSQLSNSVPRVRSSRAAWAVLSWSVTAACGSSVTRAVGPAPREPAGTDSAVAPIDHPSVASPSPVGAAAPHVSRYRYGCYDSSECRAAGAVCRRDSVIGKCSCRTDDDCLPSETCYGTTCELRCTAAPNGCPRGGTCASHCDFCVDPRQDAESRFDLDEWLAKAESGLPGHEARYLHATYDEWDGSHRHLRVSFRANGDYVIEVDGISGWNRSFVGSKPPNAKGRELLRTGILRGHGKVPVIAELSRGSCPGPLSTFRAELVLVAEFADLMVYRGLWTHPLCPSFPRSYAQMIWEFVQRETGAGVEPFDWKRYGSLPPVDLPTGKPDLERLPCWPGQSWSGKACTGQPTQCPPGYERAEEGCARCAPGRVRIGEAHACCWPGQSWDSGECRGKPACPAGFRVDDVTGCVREPEPPYESPYRRRAMDLSDDDGFH